MAYNTYNPVVVAAPNFRGVSTAMGNASNAIAQSAGILSNINKGIRDREESARNFLLKNEEASRLRERDEILLAKEKALAATAKDYANAPYATEYGATNPELDAKVLGNINAFTPTDTAMIPAPGGGMMPAVDQDTYDRQSQLQAMYEQQVPSQEKAYGAILSKAIANGADPKEATILATALTAGLTSDASLLKAAQDEAKSTNKLLETVYKEDRKDFRSDGSSSGSGKKGFNTKTWGNLQESLVKDQGNYGKWDTNTLIKQMKAAEKIEGMTPKIFAEALKRSTTAGLPWVGDVKSVDDLKENLTKELVKSQTQGNSYGNTSTGLPQTVTAYDILNADKKAKLLSQNAQFDKILSTYNKPTVENTILSSQTPKVPTTTNNGTVGSSTNGSTDTNTTNTTNAPEVPSVENNSTGIDYNKFSSDKNNPTYISLNDVSKVRESMGSDLINFDDAEKFTNAKDETVYDLDGKFFVIKDIAPKTPDTNTSTTTEKGKFNNLSAEAQKIVKEAKGKEAKNKKLLEDKAEREDKANTYKDAFDYLTTEINTLNSKGDSISVQEAKDLIDLVKSRNEITKMITSNNTSSNVANTGALLEKFKDSTVDAVSSFFDTKVDKAAKKEAKEYLLPTKPDTAEAKAIEKEFLRGLKDDSSNAPGNKTLDEQIRSKYIDKPNLEVEKKKSKEDRDERKLNYMEDAIKNNVIDKPIPLAPKPKDNRPVNSTEVLKTLKKSYGADSIDNAVKDINTLKAKGSTDADILVHLVSNYNKDIKIADLRALLGSVK